jgi:hypothetical protein
MSSLRNDANLSDPLDFVVHVEIVDEPLVLLACPFIAYPLQPPSSQSSSCQNMDSHATALISISADGCGVSDACGQ